MKILNFSVTEILPTLLDKSKTQTIRPAWEKIPKYTREDYEPDLIAPKPACFKVGEKVKVMWKQGSKYRKFCKECGGPATECPMSSLYFNKILSKIEITEVFKISLHFKKHKEGKACIIDWKGSYFSDRYKLAKKDGFKGIVEMFIVIDKMYDLSNPKEFHVYRWRWL